MLNKYKNIIIFTIIMLFTAVSPIYARQMTLDELGEELDKIAHETGKPIDSFYIIGEYVFTNQHKIETKDIMLASQSINADIKDVKNPQEGLSKMVIYRGQVHLNDQYDPDGWEILDDNYVGEGKLDIEKGNKDKKVDIKYIDYKYIAEVSEAEIKFDEDIIKNETQYSRFLKDGFGFDTNTKLYSDKENEKLTYNAETGKLTGLMLYYDIKKGFPQEDITGYYLPFVIEVPDATDDTVIKIKEDKEVTVKGSEFDVKQNAQAVALDGGKTPGVVVLWSIPGANVENKITITIDLDGPDKDEYGDTVYTIDYSDLEFQGESKANEINLTPASEDDKETLTSWGYDSKKNKGEDGQTGQLSLTKEESNPFTYKLKGTLVEQKLNDNVYGADKADGYYFDFTILLDNNTSKTAVVKAKVGESGNEKTFDKSDYDENGNLTILQRIAKDSSCATGSKSSDECSITITIDLDGDGNEYYPTTYTIDYSEVTFEKSSLVEVSDLDTISGDLDGNWNGWEPGDDYKTTSSIDPDNPNTIKVTGFIPIFDDEWTDRENPFTTAANDYYLGFKIKKVESSGSTSQTVVFLHDKDDVLEEGNGEDNKITKEDFGNNSEIYVLKYINPFKVGSSKKFTITIDFDDDGKDYAPYTLTIDWSELKFQNASRMTEIKVVDSKIDENDLTEQDKTTLESTFGYKVENAGEITVSDGNVSIDYNLEGRVKEQTLNAAAGFNLAKGYYVVLKVEGPSQEDCPDTSNKWTVQFRDESGKWKTPVKPTEEDYKNGFIVALIKLKDQGSEKSLKYKIDYDGDEKNYIPYEETINYSSLSFIPSSEIKVNGDKEDNVSIYVDEPIPAEILNQLEEEQIESIGEDFRPYRDFTYFTVGNENTIINNETKVTQDMIDDGSLNLIPHWNLYSDKFVADVLKDLNSTDADSKSENFGEEFEIEDYVENSGIVTINVIHPEVKVSRMNDTSIPGAIAHILLVDEIQEITLIAGSNPDTDKKVAFTKGDFSDNDNLKSDIQTKTKSLYSSILSENFDGKDDDNVPLSQLAQNETYKTFTLKFNTDSMAKNVTLARAPAENGISMVDETNVPTEYKFTFNSDIVSVSNLESLNRELNGNAKTIFISEGFEINGKIDVNRSVTINGNNKTLTSSSESMLNVTSSGVTIENLELKAGAQTTSLISVESNGDLTAKNLTINPTESENKLAAAFDVKGGTLTVSELKYEKEHYNHPAVRAAKSSVTVNLTDVEGKQALAKEKEKIIEDKNSNDTKAKDNDYNYVNYYNKPENSMIYKTVLYNYQGSYRISNTKYSYFGENVKIPDIDPFKKFTYDGEEYELIAFSENSRDLLRSDNEVQTGDVKKEELKAIKDDVHYWAVFKVTLPDGIKKISSVEDFKTAIKDGNTHTIHVTSPLEIDYTKDEGGILEINKDISIIGSSSLDLKIIANKIVIGDNVEKALFNRVNFEIHAQDSYDALIEVNGKKLSFWQSSLTNTGSAVDYAIKYNNETSSVVDVRYVGTSNSKFSGNNINKGYIYVVGKMAEGSTLISNTFPEIKDKTTSAIIINDFNENAVLKEDEDGEPDIRFEGNTVNTPYAIVFTKNTSGQNADIKLGNASIKVGVDYDDDHKNFGGIGLYGNPSKVNVVYIKDNIEQEKKPDDVTGIQIKAVVTPVGPVSNTANITGLTKNEDGTFSGTIAQSSNGNFYLPVVLSSSKFEDRVSKVTVTDPNGEKKEYLYSEFSEGGFSPIRTISGMNTLSTGKNVAGTMKLNLEALKTAKIKNGSKTYNISIYYDADMVADETFGIDYSDVKTEEEIILEAAKNTLSANSYTATKDNKIKNGTEKYTYKIDKINKTRLYEQGSDTSKIEQYTFDGKDVDSNSGVYVVVEKSESINSQSERPKLNGWTYVNKFSKVPDGINELELLKDFTDKEGKFTDAIATVTKDEKDEHIYTVKISRSRLENWLNATYLDGCRDETEEEKDDNHQSDNESITLKVTLDNSNKYVTKIETVGTFNIQSGETTYNENKINVTISSINSTVVNGPQKMFGTDEQEASNEVIKKFMSDGAEWWHKYTGSSGA